MSPAAAAVDSDSVPRPGFDPELEFSRRLRQASVWRFPSQSETDLEPGPPIHWQMTRMFRTPGPGLSDSDSDAAALALKLRGVRSSDVTSC
jgi:hypothetical protein